MSKHEQDGCAVNPFGKTVLDLSNDLNSHFSQNATNYANGKIFYLLGIAQQLNCVNVF